MKLLGIAGWSGSGKTTLIEAMLPRLAAMGLTVSTIKHTHHDFDTDQPGKDSWRHREAGAREVLLVGGRRMALLAEFRGAEPPPLESLVARLAPVDLVLIEGFRAMAIPKLEVYRPGLGKPPLWPDDPHIMAVASDALPLASQRAELNLNGLDQVAAWIAAASQGRVRRES